MVNSESHVSFDGAAEKEMCGGAGNVSSDGAAEKKKTCGEAKRVS